MKFLHRENVEINAFAVDLNNNWRPSNVFIAMQESSIHHSENLGAGRDALLENNSIWVLSRASIEMQKYPKLGDFIFIETWPGPAQKWVFPRHFRFLSQDEEVLGVGTSIWFVVDLDNRKYIVDEKTLQTMPQKEVIPAPLKRPKKIKINLENLEPQKRKVLYSDTDINNHFNNTRYIEWICDLLPLDIFKNKGLNSLQINYLNQAIPNQELNLFMQEKDNIHIIQGQALDGTVIFTASCSY